MPGTDTILLPIAYFPPVSYYMHLISGRRVIIEQMETYPKQTYRNRCEIITASGKMNLVIPVSKPFGSHTRTHQVLVSYREAWQKRHWRALVAAYGSSPFFLFLADYLHQLFEEKEEMLLRHNLKTMEAVNSLLGIESGFELTNDYERTPLNTLDLRKEFTPKMHGTRQIKPYSQVFEHRHGFLSDMSILDLLFNLGPAAKQYLMQSPV